MPYKDPIKADPEPVTAIEIKQAIWHLENARAEHTDSEIRQAIKHRIAELQERLSTMEQYEPPPPE
jgi:hypothetical protein